jgi:hypothetical protein
MLMETQTTSLRTIIPIDINSLTPIQVEDGATLVRGAYVERYAHDKLPNDWYHTNGFYVLLSNIKEGHKFTAYIGQTSMFGKRIKQRHETKPWWTLAVLFRREGVPFDTTQMNYLEGALRDALATSPNVTIENIANTGDKTLHPEHQWNMETITLSALRILFLRGYRNAHMAEEITKIQNNLTTKNSTLNTEQPITLIAKDNILREKIRTWRWETAKQHFAGNAHWVFSNKTLDDLITLKPQTIEELTLILGNKKTKILNDYGLTIIKLLHE